ncbi:PIN domain-containing protein [Actinomyces lilanjuaniae]|uniref:Ribonuclease VapC n=1 Tax=Actinomyces lilanjuaniae TaxID=2321394 RepID=A0ABN5PQB3_9ACTO|nr:PIN domain-containing protein [Actinomyces lilanjuaniae]AYD89239.1 PIN domain-containing protein [Actinomyces lilanjuaniae]
MVRVFLDTNVLAYAFDSASASKQAAARAALTSHRDFTVSTQVMLELFVVLTRKLRPAWPVEEARRVLHQVADLGVVLADRALVERALMTAQRHQLSVWDATVLEAVAESGCGELWTEDLTHGSVLRGVRVVNPLLSA